MDDCLTTFMNVVLMRYYNLRLAAKQSIEKGRMLTVILGKNV